MEKLGDRQCPAEPGGRLAPHVCSSPSQPSERRGGREARPRPMPAPPLGPSAATWRQHGHSASLGPPPDGVGVGGGRTAAKPTQQGRRWLRRVRARSGPLSLQGREHWTEAIFQCYWLRGWSGANPIKCPRLVIGAGRVEAKPRGQSRLGQEAPRVHSLAPHTRLSARTPRRSAGVQPGLLSYALPPLQGCQDSGAGSATSFASPRTPTFVLTPPVGSWLRQIVVT